MYVANVLFSHKLYILVGTIGRAAQDAYNARTSIQGVFVLKFFCKSIGSISYCIIGRPFNGCIGDIVINLNQGLINAYIAECITYGCDAVCPVRRGILGGRELCAEAKFTFSQKIFCETP